MDNNAIVVENLSKNYKLYKNPTDRLKEALSVKNKKYYNEHYALKDISFNVKKGETVGIIGENGAGKSTLLKIITGVLTPSSGNIKVIGKVSALLELGAGFNPEYTGIENIYLNGTMVGFSKEEISGKLESIVEFADIGEFIYQPVKTYSSGMFARLAFAVAINIEPDILIVDEALSVGDIFFQNKCFKKFEELKKNNTTILFVSHDINSVKQMCSRVLWISHGTQKMFDNRDVVCSKYIDEQRQLMNNIYQNSVDKNQYLNLEKSDNNRIYKYPKINTINDTFNSKDVEIVSCFITDKGDNITKSIKVENEYDIHVVVEFKEDVSDVIVGISIENNKGLPLFGLNNYMNSGKVFNAKSGDIIEVKFNMTLPRLMEGSYIISPAVAKGSQKNHVMLTWLNSVASINIVNDGLNASLIEIDSKVNIYDRTDKKIELY